MAGTSRRSCRICGAELRGRGKRAYCGEGCALAWAHCQLCGRPRRIPRKRLGRPFCSQTCAKLSNGLKQRVEKVAVECQWCGAGFEKYPSQIRSGRGKFCSKRCAGLGRPIDGKPSSIATEAIELFLCRTPLLAEAEKRIGRWSIDLAFPLQDTAVELDGCYWHSLPDMVEKDARKDAYLSERGWRVVHITIEAESTPQSLAAAIERAVI